MALVVVIMRKAISLNRRTGVMTGQASWTGGIGAGARVAGMGNLHQHLKDRIAGVQRAARSVGGLERTDFQHHHTPVVSPATGAIHGLHTFDHHFSAVNAGDAAGKLRRSLEGSHTVVQGPSRTITDEHGVNRRVHTFSAVNKDYQGVHRFQITERPGTDERAARSFLHGTERLADGASGAVSRTLGSVKKLPGAARKVAVKFASSWSKPAAGSNPADYAGIHATVGAAGASHVTTQAKRGNGGMFGNKNVTGYQHWFNHRNPFVKAKELHTTFQAQGHGVSDIVQKRVSVGGKIRHQYSFNVKHSQTGQMHTVSIYRPVVGTPTTP